VTGANDSRQDRRAFFRVSVKTPVSRPHTGSPRCQLNSYLIGKNRNAEIENYCFLYVIALRSPAQPPALGRSRRDNSIRGEGEKIALNSPHQSLFIKRHRAKFTPSPPIFSGKNETPTLLRRGEKGRKTATSRHARAIRPRTHSAEPRGLQPEEHLLFAGLNFTQLGRSVKN